MNKNCILSTEQLIKVIGGMKPTFKSLFTEDKGDSFLSESPMASEFPFSENSKSHESYCDDNFCLRLPDELVEVYHNFIDMRDEGQNKVGNLLEYLNMCSLDELGVNNEDIFNDFVQSLTYIAYYCWNENISNFIIE